MAFSTGDDSPNAPARIYSLAREDWLALHKEEVIDPGRAIIDAHMHLWDRPGERFLLDEALAETGSGHNVIASVFVECHAMYRSNGPEAFRPIGEVEFANGIAAQAASGRYGATRLNAAIVGHADLTLGDDVRPVLEAQISAGGGRFRGIRHSTAHDADPAISAIYPMKSANLMADAKFRCGFAHLEPLGLTFDSWLFYPQIEELVDLAKAFPHTRIVLNHCGGPIGVGNYAINPDSVFEDWRSRIRHLAEVPNVHMKLGGLAIRLLGHDFESRPTPPSSNELAETWRPIIETCIEAFGPKRCMFESNFPPDKGQCSYRMLFNAFKRIAAQYSDTEQDAMFSQSAANFYSL